VSLRFRSSLGVAAADGLVVASLAALVASELIDATAVLLKSMVIHVGYPCVSLNLIACA
jgi:hypothetical protein